MVGEISRARGLLAWPIALGILGILFQMFTWDEKGLNRYFYSALLLEYLFLSSALVLNILFLYNVRGDFASGFIAGSTFVGIGTGVNIFATVLLDYGHFDPIHLVIVVMSIPSFHFGMPALCRITRKEWTFDDYKIAHVGSLLGSALLSAVPMIVIQNLAISRSTWFLTSTSMIFNALHLILLVAVGFLSIPKRKQKLKEVPFLPVLQDSVPQEPPPYTP